MTELKCFIVRGKDHQLVIGDGDTIDDIHASGQWIACENPAEIEL